MDETLFDKVKDYCSGQMSLDEQLQFEAELTTNKDLAAVFDLYQTIEKGIFDPGENLAEEEYLLRNSLKKVHEQFIENEFQQSAAHKNASEEKHELHVVKPGAESSTIRATKDNVPTIPRDRVKRITIWRSLAIAAILIGAISITSIWFLQKEKDSAQIAAGKKEDDRSKDIIPDTTLSEDNIAKDNITAQGAAKDSHKTPVKDQEGVQIAQSTSPGKKEREALYAGSFQPDTIPAHFSGLLQEAMGHFKDQEYQDAIAAIDIAAIQTHLEEIRPRGQQDEQQAREEQQTLFYAYYYKALSYMADAHAEKAIPEMQKALGKSPDHFWQSKARWYLALAFLKTGKIKEAKTYLKQVANSERAGEYKLKALKLMSELGGNQ